MMPRAVCYFYTFNIFIHSTNQPPLHHRLPKLPPNKATTSAKTIQLEACSALPSHLFSFSKHFPVHKKNTKLSPSPSATCILGPFCTSAVSWCLIRGRQTSRNVRVLEPEQVRITLVNLICLIGIMHRDRLRTQYERPQLRE